MQAETKTKLEPPAVDVDLMLGRATAILRLACDSLYNGDHATDNQVGEALEQVIVILDDMEAEIARFQDRAMAFAENAAEPEPAKPTTKKKGKANK